MNQTNSIRTLIARTNPGTSIAFVFVGVAALFVFAVVAAPAMAGPRDTTVGLLDGLLESQSDDSVRVLVNEGDGGPIRIGEELVYRFESSRPGYLTAIHIDTQGATTLLYPRVDLEAGRVQAGQSVQLPAMSDEFQLSVQPPVGRDLVYAIVTDRPVTRKELGIDTRDVVVSYEPHEGPAFVRQLKSVLDARSESGREIRIAQVEQQIDGRGPVQYRSADIVGFFGERTRSIRPAKLDLQIQFDTNSDELNEQAKRNIDEFARALDDPKLRSMRFKVAGHTDSRGSEQFNMGLSGRRAETVRSYLIEKGGIDESRLEVEALGESLPLMQDESEYARQMNRRVEFMPLR